ncbi:hypothetical protein Syun_027524 [Stephania yunnanensis]|uniref:Uncharacterized protein n=1 Tax=Stephania yunnanensis TaxID=152371 RepID=A0AAP0EL85_9MAGN
MPKASLKLCYNANSHNSSSASILLFLQKEALPIQFRLIVFKKSLTTNSQTYMYPMNSNNHTTKEGLIILASNSYFLADVASPYWLKYPVCYATHRAMRISKQTVERPITPEQDSQQNNNDIMNAIDSMKWKPDINSRSCPKKSHYLVGLGLQLVLAAQAQGNFGTSPTYRDTDPRRFRSGLPRSNLNVKDSQPSGNEGSIGSPMQSSSPKMKEGELTTKECEDNQGATIREQNSATREQRTTREQRRKGEASARGRPGSSPTREQRRRPGKRGADQGAEARG